MSILFLRKNCHKNYLPEYFTEANMVFNKIKIFNKRKAKMYVVKLKKAVSKKKLVKS